MHLKQVKSREGISTSLPIPAAVCGISKMKLKCLILFFTAMVISLSLGACRPGSHREAPAGTPAADSAQRSAGQLDSPFVQTPELTVEDVSAKTLRLSQLKGKVVFINFWATWCPPCREEMPTIQKLKAHFKDRQDIVFLMVDIDGRLAASSTYLKKRGYDLQVYKAQGAIAPQFLGQSIPTTVIVDKTGAIVARVEGARDYSTAEVFNGIEQLLGQ